MSAMAIPPKSHAILFPVIDSTEQAFPWSLEEEFTTFLQERFQKNHRLVLNVDTQEKALETSPFQQDIDWMKKRFHRADFVVFAEIVEHTLHDKESKRRVIDKLTPDCQLDMTVRLRVIDLRNQPTVILQELVHKSHSIPRLSLPNMWDESHWKRTIFPITPLGFAHKQMIKEITQRIESYTLLAQDHPS